MSAANAAVAPSAEAHDKAPARQGKKKLLVIAAALALLLAAGGGAAAFMMKKRAAAAAAADGEEGETHAAQAAKPAKAEAKNAPTFVPLDPFTVNLADREAERYAQVGVTLELADAKAGDLLKAYMPAIRNNILLALGAKTAAQLIERDGKVRLAAEIRREALRPLGYEIRLTAAEAGASAAAPASTRAKPAASDDDEATAPIRAVHFSNFIIQ